MCHCHCHCPFASVQMETHSLTEEVGKRTLHNVGGKTSVFQEDFQTMPGKTKCRRVLEEVYSVFCVGSEHWPWSRSTLDRIEGWETNVMRRLFRFTRKEGATWIGCCMRTARSTKSVWKRMKLPFLFAMIAGSRWRAT